MTRALLLIAMVTGGYLAFGHQGAIKDFISHPAVAQTQSANGDDSQSNAKSQLDAISKDLKALLEKGQQIGAKLGREPKPEDAKKFASEAETTLSGIADQTAQPGTIMEKIAAVRAHAIAHRQEVMGMPTGAMTEDDKRRVLDAWTRVINTATKAQAAVTNIHNSLVDELEKLRKHKLAFDQLIMAGEEQAALDEVVKWTEQLKATITRLDGLLPTGPTAEAIPAKSSGILLERKATAIRKQPVLAPANYEASTAQQSAWGSTYSPPRGADRSQHAGFRYADYHAAEPATGGSDDGGPRATGSAPKHGWLGVRIRTVSPQVADQMGLPASDQDGALVVSVIPGSPAAKAGIRPGDVIVAADGTTLASAKDLQRIIAAAPIGKRLPLWVHCRCGTDIGYAPEIAELPRQYQ